MHGQIPPVQPHLAIKPFLKSHINSTVKWYLLQFHECSSGGEILLSVRLEWSHLRILTQNQPWHNHHVHCNYCTFHLRSFHSTYFQKLYKGDDLGVLSGSSGRRRMQIEWVFIRMVGVVVYDWTLCATLDYKMTSACVWTTLRPLLSGVEWWITCKEPTFF